MSTICLASPLTPQRSSLRAKPPLREGDVHLWSVSLRDEGGLCSAQAMVLSQDELRRADSFRFPRDRNRFVAARGILRRLLAMYTGMSAAEIAIHAAPGGKPFLTSPTSSMQFNISHSGDRALMAFTRGTPIGVDLEELASASRVGDLTASICTAAEAQTVARFQPPRRERAMLRLWTAKEAILKATGMGLQVSPDRIQIDPEVMEGNRSPARVTWLDAPSHLPAFCLYPLPQFETCDHASAALAVQANQDFERILWLTLAGEES